MRSSGLSCLLGICSFVQFAFFIFSKVCCISLSVHQNNYLHFKELRRNILDWSLECWTTVYVQLGHAAAQLLEAPRYKPEGGAFLSRFCLWNFASI